ncbi:hemerythrin domain-containing protein [Nonomuraea ferruginea]
MEETDVIELLIAQHGMIRNLFGEVEQAPPERRGESFTRLVRLLAVHETAEEEILHPYARTKLDGGAGGRPGPPRRGARGQEAPPGDGPGSARTRRTSCATSWRCAPPSRRTPAPRSGTSSRRSSSTPPRPSGARWAPASRPPRPWPRPTRIPAPSRRPRTCSWAPRWR